MTAIRKLKSGDYRVWGWSQDGVRLVLESAEMEFRALYAVRAERCDHGAIHTDNQAFSMVEGQPYEALLNEMYDAARQLAARVFSAEPQIDEDRIVLPKSECGGIVLYSDPSRKGIQGIHFSHPLLSQQEALALVITSLSEELGIDEEDDSS